LDFLCTTDPDMYPATSQKEAVSVRGLGAGCQAYPASCAPSTSWKGRSPCGLSCGTSVDSVIETFIGPSQGLGPFPFWGPSSPWSGVCGVP
jgi:hypothetical protein